MGKEMNVAIAGATGVIGSEILSVINDAKLSLGEVHLYASERSLGEVYDVLGDEVKIELLKDADFNNTDIVILALPSELTEEYAKKALTAGAVVIDTSSFYRMDNQALLVAPDVNLSAITKDTKLISCPNVCALQLAPVFDVINKAVGIKRAVVTALQPVAGAGKIALDELWDQTMAIFKQTEIETEAFPHQISFNCIPQVGVVQENGYTSEETNISAEVQRILNDKDFQMTVTAVRIPVFHGSSLVVNVETRKDFDIKDIALELSKKLEVIQVQDEYPMPLTVVDGMENVVGRVRQAAPNILDLWACADGIRACTAGSVLKILQQLIKIY